MWFLLLRRAFKGGLFKWLVVIGTVVVLGILGLAWYVTNSTILYTIATNEVEERFEGYDRTVVGYKESIAEKYPAQQEVVSGQRGNGVNLLLLNNLKTESYVKEMLTLYKDSAEGKISNTKYNVPIEGLLGIHYNESGTYSGTVVLDSYIPFLDGEIQWNKPWRGLPAEAMTLRTLNENVINGAPGGTFVAPYADPNKLPYNINGINKLEDGLITDSTDTRDIGVFQVKRTSFYNVSGKNTLAPAKINGYKASAGRKSDAYYLPDQLVYLNTEYSNMITKYGLEDADPLAVVGGYSIVHNGGPYIFMERSPFGVAHAQGYVKSLDRNRDNKEIVESYRKYVTAVPQDLLNGLNKLKKVPNGVRSRHLGTLVMLEEGYYLTPTAYDALTKGSTLMGRTRVAWNFYFGKAASDKEIKDYLKSKVKSVDEVIPGYATNAEFRKVYGTDLDFDYNSNGGIWKPTGETSSVYTNKLKGKDPQVFHATNMITVGHMLDSMFTGRKVYADMLKYAGVGIDPTNPSEYMNSLPKNEYKPASTEFQRILEKIGVKDADPRAVEMLEYGYNKSGFYYFLGGQAKPVSQANFESHWGFAEDAGKSGIRYFRNYIYKTTDGSIATKDTPNSKLLYYGKILYDCSSLVADAYNNTIGKSTAKITPRARIQLTDTKVLETVKSGGPKIGDIYVTKGHVYFYIASNNSGKMATLPVTESKTESPTRVNSRGMWVLEAARDKTKVGIRMRGKVGEAGYTLRRFKALAD